jgi:hypothetical protein
MAFSVAIFSPETEIPEEGAALIVGCSNGSIQLFRDVGQLQPCLLLHLKRQNLIFLFSKGKL